MDNWFINDLKIKANTFQHLKEFMIKHFNWVVLYSIAILRVEICFQHTKSIINSTHWFYKMILKQKDSHSGTFFQSKLMRRPI